MSMRPLITAAELADALDTTTVLDVRWRLGGPPGHGEYAKGHIPGARYVSLETALAAPAGRAVGTRCPKPMSSARRCGPPG